MSNKYNGSYPRAWSTRDVALYESTGREPAKTSTGLWVSDVERNAKDLNEWSLAELYALANNELFTTHQPGTEAFYRALRTKATVEDLDASRWSEEELYDWLLYERTPEKTPSGNYLNDPDRWIKDAALWNDSELQDLGAGYFGTPGRNQLYILDEACDRFELPKGITWDDYCAYIQTGVKPLLTTTGVLVNDRTRANREVRAWSEEELKAWTLGELEDPEREGALLTRAIDVFGGEWYWDREALKVWVAEGEIPEIVHDFDRYTDTELKRLISENGIDEALATLASRHAAELDLNWTVDEARLYLLDGVRPLPPVVEVEEPPEVIIPEEPEEPITEDEPDEPLCEDPDLSECPVDDAAPAEPVWPDIAWTELVPEGSVLHQALVAPTPADLIASGLGRELLSASKWSLTELVAWARGEIPAGLNTTETTLITALRAHCGLFVNHWTDGAVKTFIASQALPEGLERGVLVEDRLRDRKHPGDWSDKELKAWGCGQIRTPVSVTEIMLAARVRFKIPGRVKDEAVVEFLRTGTLPDKKVAPLDPGKVASPEQLEAWLKGHLQVDEVHWPPLFHQARVSHGIDPRWTDAHILSYFRNGLEPRQLDDGTLVEDRLRDTTSWASWSWKELRALSAGEVEAAFAIEDALDRVRTLMEVQFGVTAHRLSTEEVITFLQSEALPRVLEGGVYVNDPTRLNKAATEWRRDELKAWLRGDIPATDKASAETLWQEVYVRFEVPVFWYLEDAKSYVLHGTQVPTTANGLYLRDRNRDARPAKHWTRREIKAWCRGQILPGINAPTEDLIRQACILFGVSRLLDNASIKERIALITEESMTMTVKFVTDDLESYAKGRKEAGANVVAAAPYQSLLDRCINRVLRLEGEDFVQGWTELLRFFHQHSTGVCSPKQVYVGVGAMVITPKGLRNFQHMTTLLVNTCDPAKRDQAVKRIEWTTALKEVTNEAARQQLMAYYGIS